MSRRMKAAWRHGTDERQALADAAGVSEPAVLDALRAEGLRADLLGLLWLAPAIGMAWADGVVTRRERQVLDRVTSDEVRATGRLGARLLNRWTETRPSDAFFRAATRALAATVSALPEPERTRACNRLLAELGSVATASGGVFAIGSLSVEEQRWLREVEAELAAAAARRTRAARIQLTREGTKEEPRSGGNEEAGRGKAGGEEQR